MFNNAEPGKLTNWNSIDCGWKSRTAIIAGYEMAVVFAFGVKEVNVCCLSYVWALDSSLNLSTLSNGRKQHCRHWHPNQSIFNQRTILLKVLYLGKIGRRETIQDGLPWLLKFIYNITLVESQVNEY